MRWRITQWKPRHLLAAWCVWWAGVVVVTMGRALVAIQQVTSGPGQKGGVEAGFNNGHLSLNVVNTAKTVWSGNASLLSLVLILCGPPLVLWLLWVRSRDRYPSLKDTDAHLLNPPHAVPRSEAQRADAASQRAPASDPAASASERPAVP